MNNVILLFRERTIEIDTYFELLEDIMLKEAQISFPDGTKKSINLNLSQILRANGFLLLYNLIESSISLSIEAIHLDIINKGLDYNDIKGIVKKEIINYLKKEVKTDSFIAGVQNVTIDILKYYPPSDKIFSGNVDAREIRDIAGRYGFSTSTDFSKTKHGENLVTVKDKRNGLAHGSISFQECGKDYSFQDLLKIKNEVIAYLRGILTNIEIYLTNQEYKI